jgi:hypothetical protein
MYYIQVNSGSIYIRKCGEDFDLVEFIESDNYYDIEILRNQFEDKSLLLIHTPEIKDSEDEFITRDGHIICGGFDIVGSEGDKYALLTKDQVQEVLKEIL